MIPVKHLLLAFLISCSVAGYAQFRLYEKGHDSYKVGQYDESVKYLTEYLTKATRDKKIDIDVFYIRALAQYKQGNFAEAIPDFEETLLRGHENKGNIYWFMAKSYDKLSNSSEAINSYNNALRELQTQPEAKAKLLYERSQLYYRLGNFLQTYHDLKDGQQAHAANAEIKRSLEKLEKEQHALIRQAETDAKNPTSAKNHNGKHDKKADSAAKNSDQPVVLANSNQSKTTNTTSSSQSEQGVGSLVKNETPAVGATLAGEKAVDNVAGNSTPSVPTLADTYKEEKRYALVIGNSAYPKEIGVLRNPKNDASDIAQELRDSHFDVTLLTDATYGQIRAALMKFKEKLDAGEREKTVGLFYYAGHGLQYDDENYLVPVDATVEYEDDIPRYCFPINRMVLANMERSNTRMNIVILDACRNNPFPSLNRNLGNGGLGEMKRARGSFIAYATAPGSVASDGHGRNGLYTQELLKAMKKQGLTIEQVFKEVRSQVLKQSNNKQNTWDSSNIIGEFHFKY